MTERIANQKLRGKIMSAAEAAEFIGHGAKIGMSGFTGAAYPKEMPTAIAERAKEAHARGDEFAIDLYTGASTAPDCDGVLAEADALRFRMPYQSDPIMRKKINAGEMKYADMHLSHSAQQVSEGFFGKLDFAIVEAARITEEGHIVPSSGVGNNVEYLDAADKIIIEVNSWQSVDLEGMADVYRVQSRPNRTAIPINNPGDRVGTTYIDIDTDKVVAVIETDSPDRNSPFKPIDDVSQRIAGNFLDFLEGEVAGGRLAYDGYVMQSGVGNVPNAVMAGLLDSKFENIQAYTEVIQDGMVELLDKGTMTVASATSFALSPEAAERMNDQAEDYAKKIVLRPQDVSNNPEVIRRLGVISCNGLIEADIYGNVNSTHIMGTKIMNGIGGSGDFTRNAYISTFVSPSTAKGGDISAIVPMVSHHDHTEHDAMVIITEQGLADLRGLGPRQRAKVVIEKCAHPDYKEALTEYVERAEKGGQSALHTPHDLKEALGWHQRFVETGSMKQK